MGQGDTKLFDMWPQTAFGYGVVKQRYTLVPHVAPTHNRRLLRVRAKKARGFLVRMTSRDLGQEKLDEQVVRNVVGSVWAQEMVPSGIVICRMPAFVEIWHCCLSLLQAAPIFRSLLGLPTLDRQG